jgi:hypothetical protein
VPGVSILTCVAEAVGNATGAHVSEVILAKFHAPLRPGQSFTIELRDLASSYVSFRVATSETLIAAGKLRVSASGRNLG